MGNKSLGKTLSSVLVGTGLMSILMLFNQPQPENITPIGNYKSNFENKTLKVSKAHMGQILRDYFMIQDPADSTRMINLKNYFKRIPNSYERDIEKINFNHQVYKGFKN